MALAYLLDPCMQHQNRAGVNNVDGYFEVFEYDTDDRATVYSDFAGTLAPAHIGIDNNGRAVMVADSAIAYRVEMHAPNGDLIYAQAPVWTMASGGGIGNAVKVVSTDGSVDVQKTTVGAVTTYDLSVEGENEPSTWGSKTCSAASINVTGEWVEVPYASSQGSIVYNNGWTATKKCAVDIAASLEMDSGDSDALNNFDVKCEFLKNGSPVLRENGQLDPSKSIDRVCFEYKGAANASDVIDAKIYVRSAESLTVDLVGRAFYNEECDGLIGGGGEGALPPSTSADEGKVLTVDEDGLPEWRSLGEDSSYAIANGSIVFTSGQYYTDGAVTLSDIRSNGIEYAYNHDGWVLEKDRTYVIAFNIVASVGYAEAGHVNGRVWLDGFAETDQVWKFSIDTSVSHDESLVGSAIVCPQSTSEVHINIRYDSNSLAHIPSASVNKAEIVDVTARVSGGGGDTPQYRPGTGIDIDDDVISIDPTETQEKLTAGANIDIDSDNIISTGKTVVAAGSNVSVTSAYDGSTKTTTYTVSSQQGGQQVQSDWTEEDVSEASYIQHKPNTKPIQAGTGISVVEYADNIRISGTINAQVQSDWAEADSYDMSYVKNKPSTKQIVAGSNITITDSQGAITISSAGAGGLPIQADWSQQDSNQLDYIKNKPTIPAAQVQGNWTEQDNTSKSFILNKPTTKSIVAGTGISITETATEIIISLA